MSKEKEKDELLHALNDLLNYTKNEQAKYIIGQAIEFIKR